MVALIIHHKPFEDLLHGGLDDAFHKPVQVHQPPLSSLTLVSHGHSEQSKKYLALIKYIKTGNTQRT